MKLFAIFLTSLLLFGESLQQGRRAPQSIGQGSGSQSSGNNRRVPPPTPSTQSSGGRGSVPARGSESEGGEDEEDDDTVQFNCPKSDGLYADPANCKRFYLCGGFRAYSQSCPPSLYFDDKLKFCTFKTAALACGPIEENEEEKVATNQDKLSVCDRQRCQLPNCFCSDEGTSIPGDLQPNQTPQFVLLGFSGAINELVYDQYKKVLGYNSKFNPTQSKHNPNGCGIKGTFFINHEYANYAEIQWLAGEGHEIAIHSITHRLPEIWWTDQANYSQWAEEVIGMREIILKFANGGSSNGVLTRDNIVGFRAPYMKPGGDPMFEMIHDFGLTYDSSIVAPRTPTPIWPFTFDHRQPFDCSPNPSQNSGNSPKNTRGSEILNNDGRNGRGGPSQPRERRSIMDQNNMHSSGRTKRSSPYLGRPLKCPTKPYPGLWEVPINPYFNEFNTCHHLDQCVFPSADENDDGTDIADFLLENFNRHYTTNKAPFQLNFHVTWFTSKPKVRALNKFIDKLLKEYRDVYFVTYQQLIQYMKNPVPLDSLNLKCENKTANSACNRPHTCVLKHYLDKNNEAAEQDKSIRSDTRYMPLCFTQCPQVYPWYGNHAGSSRNFKTIMELVEDAVGPAAEEKPQQS
ncbi:chitin deacetylase 7-like isoform X2 [Brevipalpus obovatus]|uniref:chitin deacetylase 7-like isoform X2 n=1 Tax=Brevipalpus obovatus TaxID=246614 RepID=UPI003D9F2331